MDIAVSDEVGAVLGPILIISCLLPHGHVPVTCQMGIRSYLKPLVRIASKAAHLWRCF